MPRPSSKASTATLEALVTTWLARYDSPHTRAAYRADWEHFQQWSALRGVDVLAFGEVDLRRYRRACETHGAGPATVARRLSAIASFAKVALEHDVTTRPVRIDRPSLSWSSSTESLSADDAAALLAAADELDPRHGLVVRLLMLDGLKAGEVVCADVADVAGRPPRMRLTVGAGSPRVVRLHPDTARLLAGYLGARRRGPLVMSEHRARVTERLTRFGVDYLVKRSAGVAGIARPVSANTLRRRFVMAAHERGDDLDDIRDRAGHADARTTRRYLEP